MYLGAFRTLLVRFAISFCPRPFLSILLHPLVIPWPLLSTVAVPCHPAPTVARIETNRVLVYKPDAWLWPRGGMNPESYRAPLVPSSVCVRSPLVSPLSLFPLRESSLSSLSKPWPYENLRRAIIESNILQVFVSLFTLQYVVLSYEVYYYSPPIHRRPRATNRAGEDTSSCVQVGPSFTHRLPSPAPYWSVVLVCVIVIS